MQPGKAQARRRWLASGGSPTWKSSSGLALVVDNLNGRGNAVGVSVMVVGHQCFFSGSPCFSDEATRLETR